MTYGGHLEVFRGALVRISILTMVCACVIFFFKDTTFSLLLAPSEWNFCTYRWIEQFINLFNSEFHFDEFYVDLIATDLSSQFMTHITTAIYLGLLCASPFILYEMFKFVSPALLENEKQYSVQVVCTVYTLFLIGVFMSYFVIFPISFRFLGTYSVAERIHNTITLDSYISTFVTLTLLMGIIFQLPVIVFILGKMGILTSNYLAKYRRYAFLIICIISAIITPPDIFTLILVAIPIYGLYEISIFVLKKFAPRSLGENEENSTEVNLPS